MHWMWVRVSVCFNEDYVCVLAYTVQSIQLYYRATAAN